MIRRALAGAVLALAITGTVHADPRPARTVVVLPLEGGATAEEATTAQAARDLVEARLAERADLRIVEREAIDRVLADQAVGAAAGAAGAAQVGGLLSAEVAVTGTVGRSATRWQFHLRAVSVPEGALLAIADAEGEDRTLAAAAAAAADALALRLAGAVVPTRLREDPRAASSAAYLTGLGLYRAGRAAEAIGAFLEARRLASRFVETRYWMGVAFAQLGRPDQARVALGTFLAEAPTHALAGEAKGRLDRLGAAAPLPAADASDWSLLAAFLSGAPTSTRERRLEDRLGRGDLSAAEIEATLDIADSWTDVSRLLGALARTDPHRFLLRIADDVALFGSPGVLDLIRSVLTTERAEALARALVDVSPPRRADALSVVGFLSAWRRPGMALESADVRRRIDDGMAAAADSVDPAISLQPILLRANAPDALARWGARILDPYYPPAYRAALIGGFRGNVVRDPALVEGIVDLLAHEDAELRAAAIASMAWMGSGYGVGSPEDYRAWTARMLAAQARAATLARRLLAERRFPDDAEGFWAVLGRALPTDGALARTLLASPHASERAAGAHLATGDPALVADRVPALLDDEDTRVRAAAIQAAAAMPDAKDAGRLLVGWWRRRESAEGYAAHEFRLSEASMLRGTLALLQQRLLKERPATPTVPPVDIEGWEAVFR
ncbi:MAG TPA: tetratricopeptide repeat protein [Planctomycetota bacterium]|nr:tetratricopeptide repeat protein [Planctomycetota bacterium]